jgi:threonine/homoserine/homoserine lactone efflux protein
MGIELYLAFVAAAAVLIAIPGPNVAVIVANSISHGRRFGLVTVAGTSAAMIPQLAFTVIGMTGALTLLSHVFEWVRWIGIAYLIYLGFQAWKSPPLDLTKVAPASRSARRIFFQGFVVSLTNPKTLLFYGAFFPQFVNPQIGLIGQLVLLSATFLVIAVLLDSCWALAGSRLRGLLSLRGRLRNRLAGGFYFAAAVGLAGARRGS